MTATTLGCPGFALDGNIVGVMVMRAVTAKGGGRGYRDNMTSIILPAEDILKADKQAPEAKGEPAKRTRPKTPSRPHSSRAAIHQLREFRPIQWPHIARHDWRAQLDKTDGTPVGFTRPQRNGFRSRWRTI